jgi:hypothetical protein
MVDGYKKLAGAYQRLVKTRPATLIYRPSDGGLTIPAV